MLEKLNKVDQLGLANKTPVSWLHEICTRNNITPRYELLQVEGAVHEPIFQYRLTLEYNGSNFQETGAGKSKKEAKHNAARVMLASMEIAPNVTFETAGSEQSNSNVDEEQLNISNGSTEDPESSSSNPVGILQELCMKMKYPPPTYGIDSEEGLPHERLYAMACTVDDQFVQIGKGKSKKIAKRQAASLMAEFLRNLPLDAASSVAYDDDDDSIIDRIQSSKARNPATRKGKLGKPVVHDAPEDLAKQYLAMTGPIVEKLNDISFNPENPVEFVDQLGVEQNFKAMYVDFEEKSLSALYQCIVQLTLEPPVVLFGEGKCPTEAKAAAANDVVNFFSKFRRLKKHNDL